MEGFVEGCEGVASRLELLAGYADVNVDVSRGEDARYGRSTPVHNLGVRKLYPDPTRVFHVRSPRFLRESLRRRKALP